MANTYTDYTAGSNETSFSYSFTVLLESHVAVEINGTPITYNTDFTVDKATSVVTLQLGGVVGAGATAGDIVRVRRQSNPSTDLVDFADGSRLSASRLDLAYQHNRFLNEEASEISDGAIGEVTAGGSTFLDAQSREVKNLPAPTTGGSATNKTYVDAQDATTLSSAQTYADTGDSSTLSSAQTYADTGDTSTLASANAYTNSRTALTSTNLTSFGSQSFTGDGTTTSFFINTFAMQTAAEEAYDISIDGLTQSPDSYSIITPFNQITFDTAPPSGAVISVVTNAGAATINFPASFSGDDVTFDDKVTATTFEGDVTGNLTGDVTGDVTGNLTGDVTGNLTGDVTGNVTGDVTGNAQTADALSTPRTISLTGDIIGSTTFDGTGDVSITTTTPTTTAAATRTAEYQIRTETYTDIPLTISLSSSSMSLSSNAITLTAGSYLLWYSLEFKSQYSGGHVWQHRILTTSGTFPHGVPDSSESSSATYYKPYSPMNAKLVIIPTGGATFKFQFRDTSYGSANIQYVKNVTFVAQKV